MCTAARRYDRRSAPWPESHQGGACTHAHRCQHGTARLGSWGRRTQRPATDLRSQTWSQNPLFRQGYRAEMSPQQRRRELGAGSCARDAGRVTVDGRRSTRTTHESGSTAAIRPVTASDGLRQVHTDDPSYLPSALVWPEAHGTAPALVCGSTCCWAGGPGVTRGVTRRGMACAGWPWSFQQGAAPFPGSLAPRAAPPRKRRRDRSPRVRAEEV